MMIEIPNMEIIKQMLEEERKRILKHLQTPSGKGNNADKNLDQMDKAQLYSDQARSHALQTFAQKQLVQVEDALQAIAAGSYGRCQQCHEPIPLERLEIIPNATMCVNCQAYSD